jgi:arsenite methyltransferase
MSSTDLKNMAGQSAAKSKNLQNLNYRVANADSKSPQADDLKFIVQEKYGQIARANAGTSTSCCGDTGCCGELEFSMIGDEYTAVDGHFSEADLGLGCGIPTQFANLQPGQSVLDLGSGAGNDCFVARKLVGDSGMVTGLDFTPAMVEKAIANNRKLGYSNVEFVHGDIEAMPFDNNQFDVLLSNCVLNLVPEKQKAFAEMLRVLKPGGHFCISDVVTNGALPEGLKHDAVLYAGCVSGALDKNEYLELVQKAGFTTITIHKEKAIGIPENVLLNYLSEEEKQAFGTNGTGIFSITLSATKQ